MFVQVNFSPCLCVCTTLEEDVDTRYQLLAGPNPKISYVCYELHLYQEAHLCMNKIPKTDRVKKYSLMYCDTDLSLKVPVMIKKAR